jgi:hypothetical protein
MLSTMSSVEVHLMRVSACHSTNRQDSKAMRRRIVESLQRQYVQIPQAVKAMPHITMRPEAALGPVEGREREG